MRHKLEKLIIDNPETCWLILAFVWAVTLILYIKP